MSNRAYKELRKQIDGEDPFMTNGHQVLKIRGRKRSIPAWAKNDEKVRGILRRSFPKLDAQKAGRWARVIHLYFRMQKSRTDIAYEMSMTYPATNSLIRSIIRAANGYRADGSGLRKRKKVNNARIQTPFGEATNSRQGTSLADV